MFNDGYHAAVECLNKHKASLLTFYYLPAEHWRSIRTMNPIESIFATVRHRSSKTKGCVARGTMHALVYKLVEFASKKRNRLPGLERLAEVIHGVRFIDGRNRNSQHADDSISLGEEVQQVAA